VISTPVSSNFWTCSDCLSYVYGPGALATEIQVSHFIFNCYFLTIYHSCVTGHITIHELTTYCYILSQSSIILCPSYYTSNTWHTRMHLTTLFSFSLPHPSPLANSRPFQCF